MHYSNENCDISASFPGRRLFGVQVCEGNSLPHWELKQAVYHVCFRLHDSVPRHVLQKWEEEKQELAKKLSTNAGIMTDDEISALKHLGSERIEKYLDAGCGTCVLRDKRIADVVTSTLKHSDGCQYRLLAYGLMPNHVHVMMQLGGSVELTTVVQAWKSVSSHRINGLLRRTGTLWQPDYYNRIIRSEEEFRNQLNYVYGNNAVTSWRYDRIDD